MRVHSRKTCIAWDERIESYVRHFPWLHLHDFCAMAVVVEHHLRVSGVHHIRSICAPLFMTLAAFWLPEPWCQSTYNCHFVILHEHLQKHMHLIWYASITVIHNFTESTHGKLPWFGCRWWTKMHILYKWQLSSIDHHIKCILNQQVVVGDVGRHRVVEQAFDC